MSQTLGNIQPALPEIFMALAAMALLMVGVFKGDKGTSLVSSLSVLALLVTGVGVVVFTPVGVKTSIFGGLFVTDAFGVFIKLLVLAGSALAIVMSLGFNKREHIARFEFPVLIVLATLGMMMMVSANGLMSLYVGLELQSLSLYVVAAFHRDSVRSSEAGLKYFVLGALSSGMLLYGASMVYGFTGTTNFTEIAKIFGRVDHAAPSVGLIVGLVFVMAGLAFKIAAFPFHMWTPDVYEGAPTPVTAFFAAAPKLAAMALFLRVLIGPFGDLSDAWRQIIWFLALGSMLLGGFAAIAQTNIKRLLAYSSIGHIGYALVGLAAGTVDGLRGVLIYMTIYLVMVVGTFCVVLSMRRGNRMLEEIEDLKGLSRTNPLMAAVLAIMMFSMAGIPPLAGFFGKLYVFLAAIESGLYVLAIVGVLTSVVGAYYYIRIVKVMYFDEAGAPFDKPIGTTMAAIQGVTGLLVLFFFAFPGPLLAASENAIQALING
ncbi:MAG: NADH-quinone oxidoreductase subunit NuoN [Alphaproteobacteria bacterium]